MIRHSAIFIAAKAIPSLVGMATTIILTHVLTPKAYGHYGISLIVMTLGSGICFDWLILCLTRFHEARKRDPIVASTVARLFFVNLAISFVFIVAVWTLGLLSGPAGPSYIIGIVMLWSYAWFEFVSCIEIVNLRSRRYFLMNACRAGCVLVLAISAAWLTHDAVWTGLGTALGMLAGSLFRPGRVSLLESHGYDRQLAGEMIAFGLPLALAMVMGSLVFTGARAMVDWLDSTVALGYYTVAFMLVQNTLVVISSGIHSVTYQMAVRAVESGDQARTQRQLAQNGTLLLAAMLPAAAGLSLTAKGLAATFVGADFVVGVARLTPLMAAGTFFGAIRASYFDYAFQLGHRPGLLVRVLTVAAAISVGLSAVLVPAMGAAGAAVAVAVATAVSCVHAWWEGRKVLVVPLPLAAAARIVLATGFMAAVVCAIPDRAPFGFAMQVILGAATYGVAVFALNILDIRTTVLRRFTQNGHSRN